MGVSDLPVEYRDIIEDPKRIALAVLLNCFPNGFFEAIKQMDRPSAPAELPLADSIGPPNRVADMGAPGRTTPSRAVYAA